MVPPARDLIVALATAPGRGGIGIVRLSGTTEAVLAVAKKMSGCRPERAQSEQSLAPRQAHFRRFLDASGCAIDEGLVLWFPAPHSFTGESVLELQGHGSPVAMELLVRRCIELGARLARPGEFSERAFLNGRIDLTQAEAIADLINAHTESAARNAVRSLQGHFSHAIRDLAAELVALRTLTEATLDFPDEEVDFLEAADAFARLKAVQRHLADVLAKSRQGALLRTGAHVVLVGAPNVGKSSLLNRLAGEELAIVTPIAGTTRDALRGQLSLHGVPLHLIDTAGIRPTDDVVERKGIERTWREIERADLAIHLLDATSQEPEAVANLVAQLPPNLPCITVINKIDLTKECPRLERGTRAHEQATVWVSIAHDQGIDLLEKTILEAIGWQDSEDVFIARQRHLDALIRADAYLAAAAQRVDTLELFAEDLRAAHRALQEITGEYSADELLGAIFSSFCIGK